MQGSDTAIDRLGKRAIRLAKYYNLMKFILDQHVPETKDQPFETRLRVLSEKLCSLEFENAANNKAMAALEKLYGFRTDDQR